MVIIKTYIVSMEETGNLQKADCLSFCVCQGGGNTGKAVIAECKLENSRLTIFRNFDRINGEAAGHIVRQRKKRQVRVT